MRPFDKDDLIIGETICRPGIYREFTVTKGKSGFAFYEDGFYFQYNEVIIKTIRKPRTGSKEARDIVAMIARQYHRSRLTEWKVDKRGCGYNYRLRHWSENTITCLDLYQEAKSMLK
jgi:hypothetical protein